MASKKHSLKKAEHKEKKKLKKAEKDYEKAKKSPLGSGKRFKAIEEKAAASGAKNPAAVAAMAGRKAHGEKAMIKYAKMGKKRAHKAK